MNNQLELDLGLPRIKDALTDRQHRRWTRK